MSFDRDRNRILDIIDNIEAIQDYVAPMSFAQFRADQRTVDATERCLQRITEAVIKLGADRLATIAPQLPFERIRGLGNILRHEYDNIDHGSIFSVVTDELPGLLTACQEALSKGS